MSSSTTDSFTDKVTYENFSKICRSCLINRGEIDVFEAHLGELPLSKVIYICTNQMIQKVDGLSTLICNICMELLINSYTFIRTFKESQVKITNIHDTFKKQMTEIHSNISSANSAKIVKIRADDGVEDTVIKDYAEDKSMRDEEKIISSNFKQTIMESEEFDNEKYISKKGNCIQLPSLNSDIDPQVYSEQLKSNDICESSVSLDDLDLNTDDITLEQEMTYETEAKTGRKSNKRIEVDPSLRSGLDLQCFQCLTIFSSKSEMLKHHKVTSHTMAPNYKCGICLKAISKRKAYWDHMAMHRHLKKKAVCEVCGAVVVSLHLKRHMLVHQDKSHVCQYCGKGYVQKNTLTEHVKRKHEGEEKDMNTLCFICGKLCTDLKSLTTHLNTHADDTLRGLSHRCEDCGKYFMNAPSLSTHIYMAHRITDRLPNQHKRPKMIRPKPKRSSEPPKQTEDKSIKKHKHKKEKTGNKKESVKREPKECPICHKMICYLGYNRHLTTHTGVKPHQCKHCSKSFRLFTSLKSHMYVHLDLKPFKCDVCSHQFRHYTTLKVHKRVHTGEKPYSCPICSKGFRSASGLKRHQNQRQHHKTAAVDTHGDLITIEYRESKD